MQKRSVNDTTLKPAAVFPKTRGQEYELCPHSSNMSIKHSSVLDPDATKI